ncbi:MAG: FitA-like ribbon-helix-helix domain-containing protein [Acidimicrobiales bacterium]
MSKTIQIRDIDDEVYAALKRRAATRRLSVPELLRHEVERLATQPSLDEWLDRTRRRTSSTTNAEVIEALDEARGPWPGGADASS